MSKISKRSSSVVAPWLSAPWRRIQTMNVSESGQIRNPTFEQDSYDLGSDKLHDEMLKSYIRISNREHAKQWMVAYGYPAACPYIDDVIESARATHWLANLYKAIQECDLPKLRKWVKSGAELSSLTYPSIAEQLTNGMGSAQPILAPHDAWEAGNNVIRESHSVAEPLGASKSEWVTFAPHTVHLSQWKGLFEVEMPNVALRRIPPALMLVQIPRKEWKTEETAAILRAASEFLCLAIRCALSGVQPALSISTKPVASQSYEPMYVFEAKYRVVCPFQAIYAALFRRILEQQSFHFCERPDCQRAFFPRRSDARFCELPKCRKWSSDRNKRLSGA